MDVEELLERYAAGERDFSETDLSGGISLDEAYLIDINFSRANLYSIDLRHSDLSNANLRGANLRQADLGVAYLINVDLRDANLTGARLEYCNLTGADLRDANLMGANLSQANLTDTNLMGTNLRGINREEILFCHTIMPDGSIENDLIRVISTQEFLRRYATGERRFPGIVLHRADLRGQDLRGIILTHDEVVKQLKYPAHLTNANLSGANLEGCTLSGVNFRGAKLSDTNLYRAILRSADLSYADLRGANLVYADMEGVDFTGANLTRANVDDGNSLYWCTFFRNTTMPDGKVIVEPTSYGD
ncbi:pentapeptide repeat-containing protein [Nostoc sp. ChiQUE01b]|uniref:pentapeptide repeat-containing protein n=1 Tax=Nostoc sp. ChiQUE01b TaxID=3075376 RepID=UPI003A0FF5F4